MGQRQPAPATPIVEESPLRAASTELSLSTDEDTLSRVGDTSASSETLHTPSDTMSFQTAESDDGKPEFEVEAIPTVVGEIPFLQSF